MGIGNPYIENGLSLYTAVASTHVIKTTGNKGFIASVIVGTAGVTSPSLTLQDSAGVIKAVIDTTAVRTVELNLKFTDGINAVNAGATPAKVTITYV